MLEIGQKYEFERIVTENDTAAKAASGAVEVFATPFMVAWMEEAALKLAQSQLEEGKTTVGTEINIKHLKASLVGATLKVVAVLKEIDRKKLVFDVDVYEQDIQVGTGTHSRFIIDEKQFFQKLNEGKN